MGTISRLSMPARAVPCLIAMQVRAISDKRFISTISKKMLGSLNKKPELKLRGLPIVRSRILKSGPASGVAARDAAIQEQKEAEAKARALVSTGPKKRKRGEGQPGPHRVADRHATLCSCICCPQIDLHSWCRCMKR